jgi:DNA-binding MarR family transcriptional regulator
MPNTLEMLFRAARLANEEAIRRVNADAGTPVFRQAIANLLPHISFTGIRVSALADKVGVTKQAVSKVLGEMVEQGVVELVPDPADARGRLVRYTARGAQAIQHGLGVLTGIERELAAEVGERRMQELHRALLAVLTVLERS